jgi:hypothetical protein
MQIRGFFDLAILLSNDVIQWRAPYPRLAATRSGALDNSRHPRFEYQVLR